MIFRTIERRCKIAYLNENVILNCLALTATAPDDCVVKTSIEGVPPGTIVQGRFFDFTRSMDTATRCIQENLRKERNVKINDT